MNDKLDQTQRILRSPKVTTDERGRTVWIDPVETANLELISTQMLRQLIESEDTQISDGLHKIAEGEDGLLARDTDKGGFEVINDQELQRILDGTDTPEGTALRAPLQGDANSAKEDEDLELVSTQLLRVVLELEDEDSESSEGSAETGFNPYNRG